MGSPDGGEARAAATGIGSLVRAGLRHAGGSADAVVVLGHPEYYPRFGFAPACARPRL
jgi:predicted N-acetyltransferase YhbS